MICRILQHDSRHLNHWNPLFYLDPFPEVQPDETPVPTAIKAFSFEAFKPSSTSTGPSQPAPKKMKIQFKKWTRPKDSADGTTESSGLIAETETATATFNLSSELESRVRHFCDPYLLMCFLCNCAFSDKEELYEHQQRSLIHTARVETYMEIIAKEEALSDNARLTPRDRAAERRAIFGTDFSAAIVDAPSGQSPDPSQPVLDESNVGTKLLRKLGWSDGKGLGKDGQGIVDPIRVLVSFRNLTSSPYNRPSQR